MALDRFAFAHERRMKGETWQSIFERWEPHWKKRSKKHWRERSKGGADPRWRFQRDYVRTMRMLLRPQIAPAFRAQVAKRAAELVQLRCRLAAEANVGHLVALSMGVAPKDYEAARQALAPARPRAPRDPARGGSRRTPKSA